MVGESRAAWLTWYSGRHGIDLGKSFAYADSHSDLPMLRSVNNAVAVSPDVHLQRYARSNRWPIVDWASRSLASRLTLPKVDRG
jgi:phosphoserine phosphatase